MVQTKRQHARQAKQRRKTEIQIVEYLVSGGAYFWSGYLAFFVCYQLFHLNLFYSKIIADVVGWIVNYSLQRYWVFKNADLSKHQTQVTGRYIIITLVDFVLDYIIVWSLKQHGLSPYLGQFVSAGFFTVWNYIFYKYWVFPNHRKAGRAT